MRGVLIATEIIDTSAHWRLHPDVALRPEPFGALAYHYGSRRLTFLRSLELAGLVGALDSYHSLDAALDAWAPEDRRDAFCRAVELLAGSNFVERTA